MEETISNMNHMMAIVAGLGLSAAAGFRVFVPLLALGIAGNMGLMPVSEEFAWVTSWPAMILFGTATLAEIGSYYIPWIDNMLDTVASPLAVASGTVITAALLPDMNNVVQWGLAGVLGGGSAGLIQAGTVLTRGASTATSGGLANPIVSTAETGTSIVASILTIVIPIVMAVIVLCLLVYIIIKLIKRFTQKSAPAT